jgi:hypothetical protein
LHEQDARVTKDMSDTARIHSIDAVMAFKTSMVKFTEIANVALSSAEGELRRMMVWLESEQLMHWQTQIRKRQEALTRAKDAVRQKMLYPDSTGRTPTPVEEWKQQKICQQRLEEAEQKLVNTRRAIRLLEKEMQVYKGSVRDDGAVGCSPCHRAIGPSLRPPGDVRIHDGSLDGAGGCGGLRRIGMGRC